MESVKIEDIVTMAGLDHASIHSNRLTETTGTLAYDVLMSLNRVLPKIVA